MLHLCHRTHPGLVLDCGRRGEFPFLGFESLRLRIRFPLPLTTSATPSSVDRPWWPGVPVPRRWPGPPRGGIPFSTVSLRVSLLRVPLPDRTATRDSLPGFGEACFYALNLYPFRCLLFPTERLRLNSAGQPSRRDGDGLRPFFLPPQRFSVRFRSLPTMGRADSSPAPAMKPPCRCRR